MCKLNAVKVDAYEEQKKLKKDKTNLTIKCSMKWRENMEKHGVL